MLKRLRDHLKNKKGFTMVELIIVIVIILILSAALVPQLLKYVEQANKANCQSEAATLLAQTQADWVGAQAGVEGVTFGNDYKVQGISVTQVSGDTLTAPNLATGQTKGATFLVKDKEIVGFYYTDSKYDAQWDGNSLGWELTEHK